MREPVPHRPPWLTVLVFLLTGPVSVPYWIVQQVRGRKTWFDSGFDEVDPVPDLAESTAVSESSDQGQMADPYAPWRLVLFVLFAPIAVPFWLVGRLLKPGAWFGPRRAANINAMSGEEFELHVAQRLRRRGWKVTGTRASGDFGVDLIARRRFKKVAIQVKRYQGVVGVAAVQEALTGKQYYDCNSAWVVTNSHFTKAAWQLATKTKCELYTFDEL